MVWTRPERAGKGPAPSHSRAEITAAAIALADSEGIDAVSMRRVAAKLGAGTGTLYRYLAGKDDLIDLMIDAVEGEDGGPAPLSGDWRQDLRAFARRARSIIHRHPWVAVLAAGRPTLGPNGLRLAEHTLDSDRGTGAHHRRHARERRDPAGVRARLHPGRAGRAGGNPPLRAGP